VLVGVSMANLRVAVATIGAALLFGGSLPASANTYDLDFADTNGDSFQLMLTTSGPITPTGTTVTNITGFFDVFFDISPAPGLFGGDQQLYSTGPLVDYPGLGFYAGTTPFNLYWTNTTRSFAAGELGVCYVAGCDETSGFYPLVSGTLDGQPLQGIAATPLPSTWTMLIAGFVGLGFFAYRGSKRKSAAIAVA
jgi:hypothetical protein